MKILISSPEVDNITRYLRIWARRLAKRLEKKHDILQLEKEQVTRERFCGMVEKTNPDLVLLHGHGNYDRVCGYNNEELLNAKNVGILKGKTVHALSCRSGKVLGEAAVKNGAKAYVGYKENWVLVMRGGKLSNPLDDEIATLFLDPAFAAEEALAGGKNPEEAAKIAKRKYMENVRRALNSDVQSDLEKCAPYLFADAQNLIVWEK